jgi:hypothetical protein
VIDASIDVWHVSLKKKESFKSDRFDECEIECSEIKMRIRSLIKKKK